MKDRRWIRQAAAGLWILMIVSSFFGSAFAGDVQPDMQLRPIRKPDSTQAVQMPVPIPTDCVPDQLCSLSGYYPYFRPDERYHVYSAPSPESLRGGNGKAKVSTNGWIEVFGADCDYLLICYEIDENHQRFGYIKDDALPGAAAEQINWTRYPASIVSNCDLTDDPFYSKKALLTLRKGEQVQFLAQYQGWAYIEYFGQEWARGFVPAEQINIR